jgi:hypothetical protein
MPLLYTELRRDSEKFVIKPANVIYERKDGAVPEKFQVSRATKRQVIDSRAGDYLETDTVGTAARSRKRSVSRIVGPN